MRRSHFFMLVVLILAAGAGAWLTGPGKGQDAKLPKQPEPGRFQYVRSGGGQGLLDTATGKLYGPTKDLGASDRKWVLVADSPADLSGEVARASRLGRFHYDPGFALVDTATGKTYKLVGDKAPYKWSLDIPAPAE